jgi:tetratricopeptide (TPR) repeat protein
MIGELYLEMGDLEGAEENLHQALGIAEEIDAPLELAAVYYDLGLLYKQKGQKDKAREYLRQVQGIYYRIGSPEYNEIKQEILELSSN